MLWAPPKLGAASAPMYYEYTVGLQGVKVMVTAIQDYGSLLMQYFREFTADATAVADGTAWLEEK